MKNCIEQENNVIKEEFFDDHMDDFIEDFDLEGAIEVTIFTNL